MQENRIILFTRRFPYFKTEAFLEAEIPILAKNFREIVIIPAEIGNEKRIVPDNVKVDPDFSLLFKNRRKRVIKTLFSRLFWRGIYQHRQQIKSFKAIKLLFRFSSSVDVYSSYLRTLELKENDILYSYWFSEAPKALIEVKRKRKDVKVVSRAHRYDIYENQSDTPLFWPFRREILNDIDEVFCISDNGKEYIQDKYGVHNKISVSKLGVFDKKKMTPTTEGGAISFVSVSRIDPMKRVHLIAASIVEYARSHPGMSIIWTHFGDGKERLMIKDSILSLPNLTVHLDGLVPNSYIYEYYEQNPVSIFINLSSSEGIPVSIMEAQSFGIPVLASNVGGTGEIVDDETGILLGSNPTITEVTNAIDLVWEKNLTREDIKKKWNERFNAETNYSDFVDKLRFLINDR